MARTLGYLRVSTNEARQHGRGQRKALRDAGCDRIYEDAASGAKSFRTRPQLMALLDDAEEGDTVLVYSLSRATRSLADLLDLLGTLEGKGVHLRSVSEGHFDTSSPHGRFTVVLLTALAELELSWTRDRVRSGLAAARAQGRVGGRKPKLSAEQVALAKRLRGEGQTINAIGGILGVSRPTVYKALAA